jgi:hypothetical protein
VKIYLLDEPSNLNKHKDAFKYARFTHAGTWTRAGLCELCGSQLSRLVEPLQITWDEGSDVIGDFSWCGYTMVITDRVKSALCEAGYPCRFGKVEVIPYPYEQSKRKRQVPYPYNGTGLHWLMARDHIRLDEKESKVKLEADCVLCKEKRYTFKREGIVIDEPAWGSQHIFEIEQFDPSGAAFVTEQGLEVMLVNRFTNLAHPEAGVIRGTGRAKM